MPAVPPRAAAARGGVCPCGARGSRCHRCPCPGRARHIISVIVPNKNERALLQKNGNALFVRRLRPLGKLPIRSPVRAGVLALGSAGRGLRCRCVRRLWLHQPQVHGELLVVARPPPVMSDGDDAVLHALGGGFVPLLCPVPGVLGQQRIAFLKLSREHGPRCHVGTAGFGGTRSSLPGVAGRLPISRDEG